MRTIDRYVIREILPPFFLSLLIFTFILEIPPVMRDLEKLVAKGVSWGTAGRILLTLIPQGLGLTIPMATLTGILVGLGRLSADREAVALLACGVSPYRLLRPVLAFAVVATGATLYVMLQAIPDANQTFRNITFDLVSQKLASDIRPRVFFEDFPGFVLYTRDQDARWRRWKDVMVADNRQPESGSVYMAEGGQLVIDRAQRRVGLILDQRRPATRADRPGETSMYSFPDQVQLSLDPRPVFGRQELPRTVTEKSIAELQADAARKLKERLLPAPGDHVRPAEILDPGGVSGVRGHRSRARPDLVARHQDGGIRRRSGGGVRLLRDPRNRRRADPRPLPGHRGGARRLATTPAGRTPTSPAGGRTSSWARSASAR